MRLESAFLFTSEDTRAINHFIFSMGPDASTFFLGTWKSYKRYNELKTQLQRKHVRAKRLAQLNSASLSVEKSQEKSFKEQ